MAMGDGELELGVPVARFDDLVGAGSSFELIGPRGVLVARAPHEVRGVLAGVERATADGCWAGGFVAYEAAGGLDEHLETRAAGAGEPFAELPLAWFALFDEARQVPSLRELPPPRPGHAALQWTIDLGAEAHAVDVEAIRARIAAGDTYECNLTTRLRAVALGDPFELYRCLALAQLGSYNAYLDTGRYVVASASPELFFQWDDELLTTRPMKGTAARGSCTQEDEASAARLQASEKDRAENVMIVDLMRNDLGRVASWGSVEVPELWVLEQFPTVWQLTSTVTARPRPGTGLSQIFEALFPSGSVTGAPKRSTMKLIASLEPTSRGLYCGAIGVVAPPGAAWRARFNVAIRTAVVDRRDDVAVYGSGGAITWDSCASDEYRELLVKAAVLGIDPDRSRSSR
jgi:para-aminobenzoate synthetase/4-amino-4-deoxychorismate lyase